MSSSLTTLSTMLLEERLVVYGKRGPSVCLMFSYAFCYLFLYVLQQEGGGSQVVHWNVEEALDLFLVEVHGDQVGETCTNKVTLSVVTLAGAIVVELSNQRCA